MGEETEGYGTPCVEMPCPPFEEIPPPAAPETVRLRLSQLPESVLQLLATKTRHPQCLITKAHPEHQLLRAGTSGFTCGGAPKPPRA
jgi:hypothetical protein